MSDIALVFVLFAGTMLCATLADVLSIRRLPSLGAALAALSFLIATFLQLIASSP